MPGIAQSTVLAGARLAFTRLRARRLGLREDAIDFFEEHVEADSVHENIALYDMAQELAIAEPALTGDILFGVRALLLLDARFAAHLLDRWEAGASSLLDLDAATP